MKSNHQTPELHRTQIVSIIIIIMAKPLGLWDLSSLTKDWTQGPSNESAQSQPLDLQGIPGTQIKNH